MREGKQAGARLRRAMKNNKKKNVVTRQTDLGLLKHPGCSGREMPGGRLKQIQRRRLGIQ